jgi:hypothetical protein
VIGNLISAFVLDYISHENYFFMMTGIAAFATLLLATLREPLKVVDAVDDEGNIISIVPGL